MEELFLPYELALIAKEKGFNDPCLAIYTKSKILSMESNNPTGEYYFYNKDLLAPLYQQIVDWFRDTHKLHIVVEFDKMKEKDDDEDYILYQFRINEQWSVGKDWYDYKFGFKHIIINHNVGSYYEAMNKAIFEAFKLI